MNDATGSLLDIYIDHVMVYQAGQHGFYINSASKVWLESCYAEDCTGSGVRNAAGTVVWNGGYVFGNLLYGFDTTSGVALDINGAHVFNNGQTAAAGVGGALDVWSTNGAVSINGGLWTNNGGANNPAILIKDSSAGYCSLNINGVTFNESRSGASRCTYWIKSGQNAAVRLSGTGNRFIGSPQTAPMLWTPQTANLINFANNPGFNDTVGAIATPWATAQTKMGLEGSSATVVASTAYTVDGTPLYVVSTGGTSVSITIKDPAGNTVQSGLATFAGILPVGYSFNVGAASPVPTVYVGVA